MGLGAVRCAVGWTGIGNRCFLPVVTERVAWTTAYDRCWRRGAQLVQIKKYTIPHILFVLQH